MQAKVLYDFQAQEGTGEITIFANETVNVTRQDVGEGWWEGVNGRGESGLFPAGYVEMMSSPPPQQPPPPLPNQISYDAADADWGDDDWDDDDSQTSTNAGDNYYGNMSSAPVPHTTLPATGNANQNKASAPVRKSFNRFSTFVKSGGEDYILGIKTLHVPDDSYIYIVEIDGQIKWNPNQHPYTCCVEKPKKESKMKGLKSFIAYQLTPTITNIQVSRRYKHFDWLYERLQDKYTTIPIPALPDKQISGRYQEEFIEHRKTQLQSWVNRICRHPVLSQSDVWIHFITCTADEKRWKAGKRRAEKDELVGASLFFAIKTPSQTSLENSEVERELDNFNRFICKMDDACKHLFNTAQDQSKKFAGPYRREFSKIANSFGHLAAAFELSNLRSTRSSSLNDAIKHTSDTYEDIGKLYEQQPKNGKEIHVLLKTVH